MAPSRFEVYNNIGLEDLCDEVRVNFYRVIATMCTHAAEHARQLDMTAQTQATKELGRQSLEWVSDVEAYVLYRKQVVLPYLKELGHKNAEGHNCKTCAGGCKAQHGMHALNFKSSYTELEKKLKEFNVILAGKHNLNDLQCKALLTQLRLLHAGVNDMLCMEQEVLLPKLTAAQEQINAYS